MRYKCKHRFHKKTTKNHATSMKIQSPGGASQNCTRVENIFTINVQYTSNTSLLMGNIVTSWPRDRIYIPVIDRKANQISNAANVDIPRIKVSPTRPNCWENALWLNLKFKIIPSLVQPRVGEEALKSHL